MWRMRDERGAAAVLVAIVVPVLLLGLGALVISVGGWYVARGMDQNAADAAVIAVARTCMDDGGCDPTAADPYVDGVSNGSLAEDALKVCGSAPNLPSCSSVDVAEDDFQCPVANPSPYVSVLVTPLNDDGSSTMDNWFSSGDQAVGACAQAALGPPGTGTGVAVTISKCEWFLNTDDGEAFADSPPDPPAFPFTINARRDAVEYRTDPADPATNFYVDNGIEHDGTAPIAGSETVITTHGFDEAVGCSGDEFNSPGNFGWLSNDECHVDISDPYEADTGNDPAPCYDAFVESRDTGEPVYIPVYASVTGSGSGASHDLAGFAAFVVTGWDITNGGPDWPEKDVPSTLGLDQGVDDAYYCGKPNNGYTGSNSDICIYGYFTEALIQGGDFTGGGDEDLGLGHAFLAG